MVMAQVARRIVVPFRDRQRRHAFLCPLSYWDAAIVAAARALGCQKLYSEDMSHGREIEGVTIINPFR